MNAGGVVVGNKFRAEVVELWSCGGEQGERRRGRVVLNVSRAEFEKGWRGGREQDERKYGGVVGDGEECEKRDGGLDESRWGRV